MSEPNRWALEKAAQAWCTDKTRHIEMNVELAEAFAEILDALVKDTRWAMAKVERLSTRPADYRRAQHFLETVKP